MTNNPTIREQSYRYFLQEAPELLQILEQELLSLKADYSINKVHTLMRTTHTLKGAAASIELETIKSVAHSLEDIFKALFNPDLSIDAEVEALLFEGYECLHLAITAELTGGQVNDAEILDRTATVFAQLQDKLGNCFGEEAQIPSSLELGFDVTQSIFEVGVAQRLDEIAAAIASGDSQAIAAMLQTQAEVFQGLAESLNLPGFGAIARTAIAALDAHPQQVASIAQIALANLQAGQEAVLNGDRTQGGQPSLALQQLAGFTTHSTELRDRESERVGEERRGGEPQVSSGNIEQILPFSSSSKELLTQSDLSWIADTDLELSMSGGQNEELSNSLLESIWGGEAILNALSEQNSLASADSTSTTRSDLEEVSASDRDAPTPEMPAQSQASPQASTTEPVSFLLSRAKAYSNNTHIPTPEASEPTSIPQKEQVPESRTVRIDLEHLEQLNYSIGELLTNQNRQSLQNDQLQTGVRSLLTRLNQHQQLLSELQQWSDRLFIVPEQQRIEGWGMGHGESVIDNTLLNSHNLIQNPKSKIQNQFDSLELDRYSEAQILVQSILENAVQLAEASEAIELFAHQSDRTLDKQRRLLTSTRDVLMEARMLPLGEIFSRFPRVLQQLETLHNKPVALELRGTEVLVDKVVAQKLYSPLLHLVRNAFAHGIEAPAVRQQQGKQKMGQIEISAYHRGKFLVIEVRDDGQGLDFEAIRQRAVERQLVSPERANSLNEAQLTNLLFEPGFSTASQVNDLSGRGIGLDVVRAQLDALQGAIAVYSEPHRGTTFILQIPLKLTIAKLLLTQAGNRIYALLTDAIEQVLIPQRHQVQCWDGGKVIRWSQGADEELIPVHRLSEVLDYCSLLPEAALLSESKAPMISEGQEIPLILIRCQERLVGLEVDQLIGEQELVIRPLGEVIAPPAYIYGGSILADGRLALAIDGAALMQYVRDRISTGRIASLPFSKAPDYATSNWASLPPILSSHSKPQQLPNQACAALPAAPASDFQARSSQTILLVDDSITLRQTLALTLQKAGYQVLQAKDGYEAIEQLRYHINNIQLVICDIEMPRMNGFEFLKYRQQDPDLANIPTVILTSRSGEKHRLIAAELGATDYLTKPFLEHKLLSTITDVLKRNTLNSVPQ